MRWHSYLTALVLFPLLTPPTCLTPYRHTPDVESFFFGTSLIVVALGSAYSFFHSRVEEDEEWFGPAKLALEVVIIALLIGSTSVGILYMCRGYQKHGWVHTREAGTQARHELSRRLRSGKVAVLHRTSSLRESVEASKRRSRAGSSMPGDEVVAKPTNVQVELPSYDRAVTSSGTWSVDLRSCSAQTYV